MSSKTNIKELFVKALVLQFIILLATGYLAYLFLLYPYYSNEFGFGRKVELREGRYDITLSTGRTMSTLIIESDRPIHVYLNNVSEGYGTYIKIRLKEYLLVNLTILGEHNTSLYIKLVKDIPYFEVVLSLVLLIVSLPFYISNIRRMRKPPI